MTTTFAVTAKIADSYLDVAIIERVVVDGFAARGSRD
jgi:hypothetical protein